MLLVNREIEGWIINMSYNYVFIGFLLLEWVFWELKLLFFCFFKISNMCLINGRYIVNVEWKGESSKENDLVRWVFLGRKYKMRSL